MRFDPSATSPRETALLIIECQNGIVGRGSVLPDLAVEAAGILPVIGRLAHGAREQGVQVCHLTFCPVAATASAGRTARLFHSVIPQMADWSPGDEATRVVDEIGVGTGDLVLQRSSGLSPTHGTDTFAILRNLGIKAVVVAGASTNIAIPVVLTNAVDQGFAVIVARDAVIGSPADYAEATLRHTIGMIAQLTTVDELLARWQVTAPTEGFRPAPVNM
ncbi:MAG: isochorismatase family protein [Pseudonocardiales bacterium]|nr:isochorismatase family protein [Pseudonocardiales bacterium]